MANVREITDDNFESEVLKSSTPFLLDFSAVWCGPCKAIAPIVEKLAVQYAGRVGFGQVDVDHSPKVSTQFMVRAIPTLLLFKDGQVLGQLTGAHPQAKIEELIDKAL